jgi:hypothetical protein
MKENRARFGAPSFLKLVLDAYQPFAPFRHWLHLISDSLQCIPQAFRASFQRAPFLGRQFWLHHFEYSGVADDARQR